MIKMCTSIEQSKKLLSLGLYPNTADMFYTFNRDFNGNIIGFLPSPLVSDGFIDIDGGEIPCWSLAALLELMSDGVQTYKTYNYVRIDITFVHNGIVTGSKRVEDKTYINAAFEMVCWLIEQKHIKVNK
jgi:hypothetical protein